MIISQRCLWAAAITLILSLPRGQADAHYGHPREDTPPTSTPTSPPTTSGGGDSVGHSATYFETEWMPFEDPFVLKSTFDVSYNVTSTNPTIAQQGDLLLNVLWTSATSGTPDFTNTYCVVYSVLYDCNTGAGDQKCTYTQGNNGAASLNLTSNPALPFPSTTDDILKNFFFCLGINFDSTQSSFFCESYSPFFDLNVKEKTVQQQKRADGIPQLSMAIPSTVMTIISYSTFVVQSSSAVTPGPNPSMPAVTRTGESSFISRTTLSIPPTGTTTGTVQPSETSATDPASVARPKSSNDGLSTGAIVGIAIGGFLVLLFGLLVAFFCYRRNRRRTLRTPEQVLLTHNLHNGSRDLMAEKSEADGPMLGSILEARRSSGPYDHLASPVGSDTLPEQISVPQRHPTSATMNTVHTEVSNISRGISDASGPISPRSTIMRGDFEEPYQDMPRYGDTRHIPQVYQGALQAPFLSEPGMTDEELTRLEEEERRIDAAILAAEARRS